MSSIEVKVPNVGVEGDVEVVEVCVQAGDSIEVDSSLIVLESDKATVEVPSPCAGKVESVAIKVGDKVREGVLVLVLETESAPAVDDTSRDSLENISESKPEQAHVERELLAGKGTQLVKVSIPDLGGSEAVEVIEVLVKPGEPIALDQAMLVLESDKATMEIPSSESGLLKSLTVKVGDKVSEGDIFAELEVSSHETQVEGNGSAKDLETIEKAEVKEDVQRESVSKERIVVTQQSHDVSDGAAHRIHAGPAVRKFAREHGVELHRVKGTGPRDRILKEDLRDYIKSQVQIAQGGGGSGTGLPDISLPDFSAFGEIEKIKMDKVQRVTAKNMQASWLTVPHVTQFDEADITELEAFRKSHKAQAEARGVKLTPVAFIIKACAYVLGHLPQFNVSLDMKNEQVIHKKYVHIGLAVDTPAGLVVPVIRNVDTKNLWQIAEECQDLAVRAKDRKLTPSDMQGACFTISSLGGIGGTAFTPIVNTPEVAILGVSKAQTKPVWSENEGFVPRLMLPLSLSYDHRAVNGADAARFTSLMSMVLGDLRELLL